MAQSPQFPPTTRVYCWRIKNSLSFSDKSQNLVSGEICWTPIFHGSNQLPGYAPWEFCTSNVGCGRCSPPLPRSRRISPGERMVEHGGTLSIGWNRCRAGLQDGNRSGIPFEEASHGEPKKEESRFEKGSFVRPKPAWNKHVQAMLGEFPLLSGFTEWFGTWSLYQLLVVLGIDSLTWHEENVIGWTKPTSSV